MNFDPTFGSPSGGAPSNSHLDQQIGNAERLRQAGDPAGALTLMERIVRAHPSNVRALNEKGICLRLLGQPVKASMELRKARKLAPKSPELLANLGDCLRDEGDHERALKAYQKAVEIRPKMAAVHCEIGSTLQAMKRPKQAVAAYTKGLALNPSLPGPLANLGSASLEIGEIQQALEMADRSLALDPINRRALSVKAFALHELGREEEAAQLFDLDIIRPFQFDSVEGFDSVEAFSLALSEHVTRHPTLEYEPAQRSTSKGEQTSELLEGPRGPVAQLEKMILTSVEAFLDGLPSGTDHPYYAHRPSKWRLNIWGTRLGSQGHQTCHIHPGGWVSGVYYAQLPPEMSSNEGDTAGWIEFGKAPDACLLERKRPLRLIAPTEGTLVLFPSYYHHRTLPFNSDIKRISIAFDAIPMG
jgi:uncharacterized protein (TIGR02466 family)